MGVFGFVRDPKCSGSPCRVLYWSVTCSRLRKPSSILWRIDGRARCCCRDCWNISVAVDQGKHRRPTLTERLWTVRKRGFGKHLEESTERTQGLHVEGGGEGTHQG